MRGRFNKVLSGAGHGSYNGKVKTSAGETVDEDLAILGTGPMWGGRQGRVPK